MCSFLKKMGIGIVFQYELHNVKNDTFIYKRRIRSGVGKDNEQRN